MLFQFYNADSFVYTTGMTIRSVEQTVIMLAVCIAADYLIGRIPVARRLLLGGR